MPRAESLDPGLEVESVLRDGGEHQIGHGSTVPWRHDICVKGRGIERVDAIRA